MLVHSRQGRRTQRRQMLRLKLRAKEERGRIPTARTLYHMSSHVLELSSTAEQQRSGPKGLMQSKRATPRIASSAHGTGNN